MKSHVVVAALLVVTIILSLNLPWYPVLTSESSTQIFTYTYYVPTTSTSSQSLYTLPSPITLEGMLGSAPTSSTGFYNELGGVVLQKGSVVQVQFTGCGTCSIFIAENFGSKLTVYDVTGSSIADFLVPESGIYTITVDDIGASTGVVSSVMITADVPQVVVGAETGTNVAPYTIYGREYMSPMVILALGLPSNLTVFFLIIVLLLLATSFSIIALFGGLTSSAHLTIKVSRRRKRR